VGTLIRPDKLAAIVGALALLAALGAGVGAAAGGREGAGPGWARLLAQEEARFPAIAPLAATQVTSRPLYLEVAYVAGAIGGWGERQVCPLLDRDPHGFLLAARHVLFARHAAYAYARARRWRPAEVVGAYRDGVAFGCSRR
jgi:hypothetical protein